MNNLFRNEKFWLVAAGAAGALIGSALLTSKKTRELAVIGLAKSMKFANDAKAAFQDMKDEAEDLCYEAREQAGLADENKDRTAVTEECATE